IGFHFDKLRNNGESTDLHPLTAAVMAALREVIGTYGIAVMSADFPGVIVGGRRGSPLILGVGEHENFLASDASAIVAHTQQAVYVNESNVVTITADDFKLANLGSDTAQAQIRQIEFSADAADKGSFPHYML